MNAKEAAQKWQVSLSTIYSYLKNDLISYAIKNENGHWVIDDKALKPYLLKQRKFLSEEKIYQHILNALNNRQSISKNQIDGTLQDYFYVLEKSGNIVKLENSYHPDLFTQYKPTQQGLSTLKNKVKLIELVKLGLDILSFL